MIVKHKETGEVLSVTQGSGFFGSLYYRGFFKGEFKEFKDQDLELGYVPSQVEACELFENEARDRYSLEAECKDLRTHYSNLHNRLTELLESLKNRREKRRYEVAREVLSNQMLARNEQQVSDPDWRKRLADRAIEYADELLKSLENDDTNNETL